MTVLVVHRTLKGVETLGVLPKISTTCGKRCGNQGLLLGFSVVACRSGFLAILLITFGFYSLY
jgi:hypothetical protein